jgi:hypothetical protein
MVSMADGHPTRTESEALFEQYLHTNAHVDWEFEPEIGGQTKHPDYLVRWQGMELLFEVKELRAKDTWDKDESEYQIGYGDPCEGLRREINEARKKFRNLKEWCCSLVVRRIDDSRTMLEPTYVFSAMLGNIVFTGNYDALVGMVQPDSLRAAFGNGGKMVGPKTKRPQNTTISSIVVLKLLGGQPRVVVCENPFARIPLPRAVLCGSLDERWSCEPALTRVFAGHKLGYAT